MHNIIEARQKNEVNFLVTGVIFHGCFILGIVGLCLGGIQTLIQMNCRVDNPCLRFMCTGGRYSFAAVWKGMLPHL